MLSSDWSICSGDETMLQDLLSRMNELKYNIFNYVAIHCEVKANWINIKIVLKQWINNLAKLCVYFYFFDGESLKRIHHLLNFLAADFKERVYKNKEWIHLSDSDQLHPFWAHPNLFWNKCIFSIFNLQSFPSFKVNKKKDLFVSG